MRETGFPIVIQVSCEPDTVTGSPAAPWRGLEACFEKLAAARRDFADSWGTPIVLSWMLRADLHIEEVWGDTGWALKTYAPQIQALVDEGDFLGLHAHPIRERRNVEDYRDEQWTVDTLGAGIDAFDAHFGHPPACVSWGRGWTSDSVLALLCERGVAVDMSVFPGRDRTVNAGSVEMLVDVQDLSTSASTALLSGRFRLANRGGPSRRRHLGPALHHVRHRCVDGAEAPSCATAQVVGDTATPVPAPDRAELLLRHHRARIPEVHRGPRRHRAAVPDAVDPRQSTPAGVARGGRCLLHRARRRPRTVRLGHHRSGHRRAAAGSGGRAVSATAA